MDAAGNQVAVIFNDRERDVSASRWESHLLKSSLSFSLNKLSGFVNGNWLSVMSRKSDDRTRRRKNTRIDWNNQSIVEDPGTMFLLRVVHVRYRPMVIVWWTRRHSKESSSVDRAYTNLSGDILDEQDSIASDDIHLRTCRETFLVAREKGLETDQSINRQHWLDSAVSSLQRIVRGLVRSGRDDDRRDRKFVLLRCRLVFSKD